MSRHILIGLLCLWASAGKAVCQPAEIVFERIRLPGGVYENRIHDIVQDHQGSMWFGTLQGVVRYDGYAFTSYGLHGTEAAWNAEFVWDLHVDRAGMLWVASIGGLIKLDPVTGARTHVRHRSGDVDSLGADPVHAVLVDRQGTIWIATSRGVTRLNPVDSTITTFSHNPDDLAGLTSGDVFTLYEDRRGTVWAGARAPAFSPEEGGLNRYDPSTHTFTRYRHDPDDEYSLIDNRVTALYEDSRGTFWVGTFGDGLHAMDREAGTFQRHQYDPANPERVSQPRLTGQPLDRADWYTTFLHEDQSGIVWIGARAGGVNRYDPATGRVSHYEADPTDPASLSNNRVSAIAESHDGTIWIGSLAGEVLGLHKAVPVVPIRHHTPHPDGSNGANRVPALWESTDGTLWIGTADAGLSRLDRVTNSYTHYQPSPGDPLSLAHDRIWTIYETRDSLLWIGTEGGGLNSLDHSSGTFQRHPPDPPDSEGARTDVAIAIHEDRDGLLWLSMHDGHLTRFDRDADRFVHYRLDAAGVDDPREEWIFVIHESPDGSLWLGTTKGLHRFDRQLETFTRYVNDPENPTSIGAGRVTGICEDRAGRLWVGTDGSGISRLLRHTGRFVHVDVTNSNLPSNQVLGILEGDAGHLWIATETAVTRYHPDSGDMHSYTLDRRLRWEGLQHGAHHRGWSGALYLGSASGFYAFLPETVLQSDNPYPPRVVLTGFRLLDESVRSGEQVPASETLEPGGDIRLRHNQDAFAFEFAALHYSNPAENRYEYILEGYDDAWRNGGTERSATYYRVPPNSYRFRVRAASSYGVWNEEGASVSVIVLPPWWRTWWAYALYILGVAALAYAGHEVRVRSLRTQAARLQAMVEERTSDLQAEKQKTEQQARRLVKLDEAKDRFFANVSHEFRTPLTLILGPLDDALKGEFGTVGSDLRRRLRMMRRSGRRLHGLISQLLDLSKLEVGRMRVRAREGDLVAAIREIVLSFAPLAERKNIHLEFTSEAPSLVLYFDAEKVEKAVTNLLSNAFKFTPEHGEIRVNVRDEAGGFAEVSVTDTGSGIPADDLPHIFDRFYQVDTSLSRTGQGTGIGLALAKELVEVQGGQVLAESTEGVGSTFTVRIPLGKEHLSPDELAESEATVVEAAYEDDVNLEEDGEWILPGDGADVPKDAPKILIVDDNADVRLYLRSHLAGLYHVVDAEDGIEALERAREARPDLVISDVMMPRMDGYALCRALKDDYDLRHIPVVLLTSRATRQEEILGLEAGADDYITKPFNAEALMARVENLIEIRRLLRERFTREVTIQPTGVTVADADAQFLERVKDVVEAHIGDSNFTVEWLADEVAISPRQLRRRLRRMIHLSPGGYIRLIRLERAAELLEQRAGSISEIAYRVGFNDSHYFSRLFSQTFGVTPSAYASNSTD